MSNDYRDGTGNASNYDAIDAMARHWFDHDCDGLVDAIDIAATPDLYPGTVWDGYRAYYGDVVGRAVWQAKYCYRQARKLGLIDG